MRDPLLVRALLRLYPADWWDRYCDEFAALLADMTASASRLARIWVIADAFIGGIDTRLRLLRGDALPGQASGSPEVVSVYEAVRSRRIIAPDGPVLAVGGFVSWRQGMVGTGCARPQ